MSLLDVLKEHHDKVMKQDRTIQALFDNWAAVRTANNMADENGVIGTRDEFNQAVQEYIDSEYSCLDIRDFGFMYILLKQKEFPEEIISDIATYFQRQATFKELCKAYSERA